MLADEMISRIIRAAVLSARVKNPDIFPLSLFLVAPIENGKTSLALENCGEKPLIVSDVSGIGLLEALYTEKTITHVVVSDLAAVSGHKSSVSKLTISILNGLAEEGCFKIALPRMGHLDLSGRKVGVIACCTPDLLGDNRSWWKRSGFASRVLVISFRHSISLQFKILQAIANGPKVITPNNAKKVLRIPEASIAVRINRAEAQILLSISKEIAKHHGEVGYRREKQMRALACGLALLRTWKNPVVSKHDCQFIADSFPFFTDGMEI